VASQKQEKRTNYKNQDLWKIKKERNKTSKKNAVGISNIQET
jgi:hypothetical protein